MRSIIAALFLFFVFSNVSYAQDIEEITATIYNAAAAHGVSGKLVYEIIRCETVGFTQFEGDFYHGRSTSHGWGQLHEGGLLGTFYNMGYDDTYDLAQVADFMAYQISVGRRRAWSC